MPLHSAPHIAERPGLKAVDLFEAVADGRIKQLWIMAASLRISLTHRDYAQSVRFVTGHSRHGCLPEDLDWQGLAEPRPMTVVYMGGSTAGEFARRLIEAGLPGNTPAVLVGSVARQGELVRPGTVTGLEGLSAAVAEGGPALIGIGKVFHDPADALAEPRAEIPAGTRLSA